MEKLQRGSRPRTGQARSPGVATSFRQSSGQPCSRTGNPSICSLRFLSSRQSGSSRKARTSQNDSRMLGSNRSEKQKLGRHAPMRAPGWARAGGWRTAIYANSLLVVMCVIFFASWLGQSATSWREYNDAQREHGQATIGWARFLVNPTFLGGYPAKLAVRIPRSRINRRVLDLPASTRVA